MPSTNYLFSSVQAPLARTSLFNLSHEVKNTCKFGQLVPFLCQEVLPGDIWNCKTEILTRLLAMKSPIMHNVNVYTHFFFVPYRLVWDKWEQFITQSLDGQYKNDVPELPILHFSHDDSVQYLESPGTILDYLGVKANRRNFQNPVGYHINALPLLAYYRIWNDYYRDENLDIPVHDEAWQLPTGVTEFTDWSLHDRFIGTGGKPLPRAFAKDYFTSALPWTQKGDSMVLPIGGSAPVTGRTAANFAYFDLDSPIGINQPAEDLQLTNSYGNSNTSRKDSLYSFSQDITARPAIPSLTVEGSADLSQVSAVTINELRTLNALQRWTETNARGGSRYIEQLLSHFGVVSPDARLQRAEYLGGGKSPIVISEVLQNSASTIDGSDTPQGNMAGHGIGASINHSFKRRFTEHGVLIGIMSIMPKANYMQGIPRQFLKRDVFDFGWPLLANLGEQPLYESELFAQGSNLDMSKATIFGYTPRYAEYKFIPDQIAGDFRSSLDFWHLAREFSDPPQLNSKFISSASNVPRIFANNSTDYVLNQMYLNIKCVRKLPKYGTPRLI